MFIFLKRISFGQNKMKLHIALFSRLYGMLSIVCIDTTYYYTGRSVYPVNSLDRIFTVFVPIYSTHPLCTLYTVLLLLAQITQIDDV